MVAEVKNVKKDTVSEIESEIVLISTGRRPNTDDIGLDKVGVATDKVTQLVLAIQSLVTVCCAHMLFYLPLSSVRCTDWSGGC